MYNNPRIITMEIRADSAYIHIALIVETKSICLISIYAKNTLPDNNKNGVLTNSVNPNNAPPTMLQYTLSRNNNAVDTNNKHIPHCSGWRAAIGVDRKNAADIIKKLHIFSFRERYRLGSKYKDNTINKDISTYPNAWYIY